MNTKKLLAFTALLREHFDALARSDAKHDGRSNPRRGQAESEINEILEMAW